MKNHADALIFQTTICAGASQIVLVADANLIFASPLRVKLSGMEDIMFGQLFGKYLVKENALDEETLKKILAEQSKIRVKLGVIAVADKLITQEQADEINRIQQQEDRRFGDIAIEKGYLTEQQISELLDKQGNPYMQFLQVLVENSSIKVSKIDGYIESFQRELGLNDEQMNALKRDEIDGFVSAFTEEAGPYVTGIISLVLRNITRFVSGDYYFDKVKRAEQVEYRCLAAQKSKGEHDFCIGFFMKEINGTFVKVAQGYTGESFSSTGIEVYDAVGEFVNCISGLFATAMAKKGMQLEIQPQVAYENQIARGKAYILPIYIEGEEIDLYIAVDSDVELGNMPIIRKMRTSPAVFDDGSSKGTVVIVDDSGMSRKMLRNILEGAGFAVVGEASDGFEGVLAYKQLSPDVITLDITMPNMDGTEALRQIKEYDEDAKAVMITAAGQQNKVIEALKIGAEKFITKPFDKDEVVKAVEEITGR